MRASGVAIDGIHGQHREVGDLWHTEFMPLQNSLNRVCHAGGCEFESRRPAGKIEDFDENPGSFSYRRVRQQKVVAESPSDDFRPFQDGANPL